MENVGARVPRVVSVLACIALIASACSSGTATPAPATPGAATATPGGHACWRNGDPSGRYRTPAPAAGSINVLSLWGGSEETAFKNVLAAFTAKTGIAVNYEADRKTYATTLQSRLSGGNPPDIAIIPGIGFLRRFAKDGSLKKMSRTSGSTRPSRRTTPRASWMPAPSTATCTRCPRSTTTRARCGTGLTSSRRTTSPSPRPGKTSRRPSRPSRASPARCRSAPRTTGT